MPFRQLPALARVYVLTVMAGGALVIALSISQGAFARPLLVLSFVAASIAVHSMKTTMPAGGTASTISMGFAVSYASLLVLGAPATAWASAAGGWAQCNLNTKSPNPWYRTLFTMAALVLSIEAAGQILTWTGGRYLDGPADVVVPSIAASAIVYFLVNSVLVAAVI